MTEFASRPSLDSLPLELLRYIAEDPTQGCGLTLDPWLTDWLAISDRPEREVEPGRFTRTASTVRSLSQTCRRLRSFALKLLWSVVHVRSMSELGRLAEALKDTPSYAVHIRSFHFAWQPTWMQGLEYEFPILTGDEHSPLQLAFGDRSKSWHKLAKELEAELEKDVQQAIGAPTSHPHAYYQYKDREYCEPGQPIFVEGHPRDPKSYDWDSPRPGNVGPDGKGEDRYVSSVQDFNKCITLILETIASLSPLETFAWDARGAKLPAKAFDALAKLTTIKRLRPCLMLSNGDFNPHPFWTIVRGVEELDLDVRSYAQRVYDDDLDVALDPDEEIEADGSTVDEDDASDIEDTDEDSSDEDDAPNSTVAAVTVDDDPEWEIPELVEEYFRSPFDDESFTRGKHHFLAAIHTIIAAAKGGRLRRLKTDTNFSEPFALRSLVPYWINAERLEENSSGELGWGAAASFLRPLVTHASRWLNATSASVPRDDRRLSTQEFQALNTYFKQEGLPKLCNYLIKTDEGFEIDETDESDGREKAVGRYLPWLENEELAKEASKIWNAVVERGEANKVMCHCRRCQNTLLFSWIQ